MRTKKRKCLRLDVRKSVHKNTKPKWYMLLFLHKILSLCIVFVFPINLFCQIVYPEYWPDIMNVNIFRESDLGNRGINSITASLCSVNTESLEKDSIGEYYLLINNKNQPLLEKYSSETELYVNEYIYEGDTINIYRKSYVFKALTDSVMTLISTYKDVYFQNQQISSTKAYFDTWGLSSGKFSVFDTFIYNEMRLPVMIIQRWILKSDTSVIDTSIVNLSYDSTGRIIKYEKKLLTEFKEPLKYNLGCAAPFNVSSYYFQYSENGNKTCKYFGDSLELSNPSGQPVECWTKLLSSSSLDISEYVTTGNRYYMIRNSNDNGEIEINKSILKKIYYLSGSKLPERILIVNGNSIYTYSFIYRTELPPGALHSIPPRSKNK